VPNSVWIECAEQRRDGGPDAGTLGRLLAAHVHVLVGWHVVGQDHVAAAEQDGWPDDGVKRDVVFADEVVLTAASILPEALPGRWLPRQLGPLDGRRQIAAARLEPDIDAFVVPSRTDLGRQ